MTRCLAGATGGATVAGLELESTGAHALSSKLYRAHLQYEGGAACGPSSVVVKLASANDGMRMQFSAAAEREMRFYDELGSDPGIAVPRCHHVGRDDEGFFCLVLEDLAAGQIGKSRADHAAVLIEALAPFHARWWNARGLGQMEWLRAGAAEFMLFEMLPLAIDKLAALGSRFPASTRCVAERLAELGADGFALATPGPRTLIHGDLHLQQVFFRGERGGRFAVFDWQTVTSDGNPLRDLARALATSIAPDLRRAHERTWVERYHALLLEHGVVDYDLSQCWEQYRAALLTTVLQHVVGAGVGDISHFEKRSRETGVDWTDRFFGWVEATLQDHDIAARYCAKR